MVDGAMQFEFEILDGGGRGCCCDDRDVNKDPPAASR